MKLRKMGHPNFGLPAAATLDAAALGGEAVVVAHDELGFDLVDGVHGYAYDDEEAGAAEVEVDAQTLSRPCGKAVEDWADEPEVIEVDA